MAGELWNLDAVKGRVPNGLKASHAADHTSLDTHYCQYVSTMLSYASVGQKRPSSLMVIAERCRTRREKLRD